MLRLCTLAVLVAGIRAEIKSGTSTFQVDDTGYQVNGEHVKLSTDVADGADAKSLAIGDSVGARLATAENYYKIDLLKERTEATKAANKKLDGEIQQVQDWTTAGPDAIRQLEAQIAAARVKDPTIKMVIPCTGGCDTIGESEAVILLDGEIYADVPGLLTCTWKLPGGKVVHTSGVGKQTGKTGKASAAVCPTPALGPAVVTTKTLTVEVGLKIGVLAPLKMSKGKAQSVKFVAAGPKVTVDTSERLAVYADQLNAYKDNSGRSVKGAAFDFIVTDTDSAFKDMSGTLTSSGKSFGSGFVKGIKDLGNGKFHMQAVVVPKARKPSVSRDEFMVTLTVKDKFQASPGVEVPVVVIKLRQRCWNSFLYDYQQGCNTPKPDALRKRKATKTFYSSRLSYNDRSFTNYGANNFRDHFAMLNEAYVTPPKSGTYYFETASDDGSHVFIDGKEIVDNDGCHGRQHRNGKISLVGGKMYKIVSTFFEGGGGANYDVWWWGPGVSKQHVGPTYLMCD